MMESKDKLHSDHEASISALDKEKSACLYAVPAGYFDQFPDQILNLIRLETSGDDDNTLPRAKPIPFSVPENYFETLTHELLLRIRETPAGEYPGSLSSLSAENPYQVPTGYFTQLPDQLLQTLRAQETATDPKLEIRALSPLLADLKEKKPYQIPKDYFKKPGKTLPLNNAASRSIRWARWTAAASILLIFSLGAFQFFQTPTPPMAEEQSIQEALAQIPDAAIQRYLEQSINDFELNSLTQSFAMNETTTPPDNILKGVTDQEIRAYLEGNENY